MRDGYTYGDTDLAAERLDLVARAFEPTTRSFLARDGVHGPALALDLGCGPGATTRLLAETLLRGAPADLIYSRLLLSQRHDPPETVA